MSLDPKDRSKAIRSYLDKIESNFEAKRASVDRYIFMREWDSVRNAAIDLAALAQILRDTENKLADVE